MRALVAALVLVAGAARADRLELPAAVERAGSVEGRYVIEPARGGRENFTVEWTDSLGRLVSRTSGEVVLDGVSALPVRLEAGRARAMLNTVRVTLGAAGASGNFVARPGLGYWDDFHVIMYQEHAGARLAVLRGMGVDAMKVLGFRVPFTRADVAGRIAPYLAADQRWYVENIATDFYSAYHIWTPEHPVEVHFRFIEAQRLHQANPADPTVFIREPSLEDPVWLGRVVGRLEDTVRAHADYRPLYYSLGDEVGIADLAANWDFDRAPVALAAFREWLRGRYASVAALNAAWGSGFADWDAVEPEGTTAAMARTDGNYAAWNDHKRFMDFSFARAIAAGRDAVHRVDPAALAGIEGGQVAGWGGWDYALLAPAVDLMEIYENGPNVEIAQAVNPGLVTLLTLGGGGPLEQRQLWRAVLKGSRAALLWDEAGGMVGADGAPGPWAVANGALFGALRDGLGALLIASPPAPAEVAVLYSPASFRIDWLLAHRAEGDAWTRRTAETENGDTPVRVAMRAAAADLAALGLSPRWVTEEEIAAGGLAGQGVRMLVLPLVPALGDAAAGAITRFAQGGGAVVADGAVGVFDGDLRRRVGPALAEGVVRALPAQGRRAVLAAAFEGAAGHPTPVAVNALAAPVVAHRMNGRVALVALANGEGNPRVLGGAREMVLPAAAFVRDIRGAGPWQRADRLVFPLDGDGPAVFAIAPEIPPGPTLEAPETVRLGETARLRLGLEGPTPAAVSVFNVAVRDPAGRAVALYSGNALLRGVAEAWAVPFALNDPAGVWTVTVRDVLGGAVVSRAIRVVP